MYSQCSSVSFAHLLRHAPNKSTSTVAASHIRNSNVAPGKPAKSRQTAMNHLRTQRSESMAYLTSRSSSRRSPGPQRTRVWSSSHQESVHLAIHKKVFRRRKVLPIFSGDGSKGVFTDVFSVLFKQTLVTLMWSGKKAAVMLICYIFDMLGLVGSIGSKTSCGCQYSFILHLLNLPFPQLQEDRRAFGLPQALRSQDQSHGEGETHALSHSSWKEFNHLKQLW